MPRRRKKITSGDGAKPSSRVRIRTYRHGLGDCHLLSFTKPDGTLFHLLIDCGVIDGTPKRRSVMKKVAKNIAKETGGVLDVLVATHRHTDHLSGFHQARDVFKKKINMKRLWFGWTEDPANGWATWIQGEVERRLEAVRVAAKKLAKMHRKDASGINKMLDFFGARDVKVSSTAAILAALQKRNGTDITYYNPGDGFVLPEVPNVRVYVLGPSWNAVTGSRLKDGQWTAPEISADLNGFVHALCPKSGGGDPELSFPFEKWYRRNTKAMKQNKFFKENYFRKSKAWRKIDKDWLGFAEVLVGALNDLTNNTSLVLAFEFIDSGEVLLFPGDAQVASWWSWGELVWNVRDSNGNQRRVSLRDLFPNVVFYKASHHASEAGTLTGNWGWALDNMTHPDLFCVVPVDRKMTKKMGLEQKLPSQLLINQINQRTRGRTVLTDRKETPPAADQLTLLSALEQQRFAKQVTVTKDYVDCTL